MAKENLNSLVSFVTVAREKSFTKAAAKLGVSQSALSQTIRSLEERLDLKLLARTSRMVSTTDHGNHLLNTVGPHLDQIESELDAISELKDVPAGNFRITATERVAETVLWPAIEKLTRHYPDIGFEVTIDYGLTDIVLDRYDAGVRLGEDVAKDMIAVPIGPEMRMAVVGSPSYFEKYGRPKKPQDLIKYNCINMRMQSLNGISAWEFERNGRALKVRVDGKLVFNTPFLRIKAALSGLGLCYIPEDHVSEYIEKGKLIRVLESWCPPFPGYHLYYPSRRQNSLAFKLLIDEIRYRSK